MSRRKKDPLRTLTDAERLALTQLSRSQAAPAAQVARAIMLLAVADGDDYQQAARAAGRRSRPIPSGGCSTGPATATSRPAPGAPPAPPCVAARPAWRSSPTRTRSQKKVDRGRLPAGGGDGPVGLVRRPGRAVPDHALPRPLLAARVRAGVPAARVPPRRHGQGPHAVPSGRRPGATGGGDVLPQRGAPPLAAARAVRRPGRAPGGTGGGRRGGPTRLGALAGRPDGQADAPLR